MAERRLGFVGVIVENRKAASAAVNEVLSEFGERVVGRMGVPYIQKECSVIALIVDATTDELGALTGRLGGIEGVSTRSMLSKGK